MKHLSLSLIALGMATTIGTASAQSLPLSGQPQYNPQYNQSAYPVYDNGNTQNAQYDYARVINVVRVPGGGYASNDGYGNSSVGPQGQRCYTRNDGYVDRYGNSSYPNGYGNEGYGNNGYANRGYGGSQTGRTVATVVGGVVGAVLGSQVGGGSARYATSAIGSMVGGQVGGSIYDQTQRQRQQGQVTVCDPVPTSGGYNNTGYGNAYGNARYGNAQDAYDVTYEYNGRRYTSRMNYDPGQRVRIRVDVTPQ